MNKIILDIGMNIDKSIDPKEVEKSTYHSHWFIRTQAIKRLGNIGNKASEKRLIQILKNPKDKFDLIYSNQALGKLKSKKAVPVLIKLINSRINDVACSAIYSLGEIGDKSVVDSLHEKMEKSKISDIKEYCKVALDKINNKSVKKVS